MIGRTGMKRRQVAMLFDLLMVVASVATIVLPGATVADKPPHTTLPLTHVADIALPGRASRLDYESYDPSRHLLFIAHLGDSEVIVFDTRASRVIARIGNVASVHGVLAVPEQSRVYASATGTNEIVAINETTLKITARVPGGVYPDGMALVQIGAANRLELSERNELMTRDEQAEESGGVVRWTPF